MGDSPNFLNIHTSHASHITVVTPENPSTDRCRLVPIYTHNSTLTVIAADKPYLDRCVPCHRLGLDSQLALVPHGQAEAY